MPARGGHDTLERVIGISILAVLVAACAQNGKVLRDIDYAGDGEKYHRLDLYLPEGVVRPPMVVWIHGGAWRRGSKAKTPGIRFLRAHAKKYGYNAAMIGIAGSSAGGHLVALIGTTNGHKELEGRVGKHRDQSSSVQATVDYYGPTNFMTILKQSTPHGLSVRVPALELLLGDRPEKKPDLARLASPVFHVDPKDPPLLMIHGDQDPQVPINQSHELHAAYKKHGGEVIFEVVHGGAHGGKGFFDERRNNLVKDFLDKHLR